MADQYASIAEDYKRTKLHPWRTHLEVFTFFEVMGDVTGKSVLDLACGEGYYTRLIKQRGAGRVVGLDISAEMIQLARAEEARRPLGIEYVQQDAAKVERPEPFDLVVSAYLLCNARTRDELLAMTRAISDSLKPGCRFLGITNNMDQPVEAFAATKKYGVTKSVAGEQREGTVITVHIFDAERSFSLTNYYLSRQTVEWAAQTAGLTDVRWHLPRLSPQGEAEYGKEYWADFLTNSPIIFLECRKR
jgi:2-polyprenyl-3-methyl-5-hydroxy-6-metoxy-1,4-benzoquinol methylase